MAAEDKRITVDKHGDVQRYTLENKKKQLVVAKLAQKDNVFYAGNKDNTAVTDPDIAKAAVIPGAELSLYYSSTPVANYKEAFANGNVPAGVTLALKRSEKIRSAITSRIRCSICRTDSTI